jgi:hypothetical protein
MHATTLVASNLRRWMWPRRRAGTTQLTLWVPVIRPQVLTWCDVGERGWARFTLWRCDWTLRAGARTTVCRRGVDHLLRVGPGNRPNLVHGAATNRTHLPLIGRSGHRLVEAVPPLTCRLGIAPRRAMVVADVISDRQLRARTRRPCKPCDRQPPAACPRVQHPSRTASSCSPARTVQYVAVTRQNGSCASRRALMPTRALSRGHPRS